MIEKATGALRFHFPWFFIPYQIDLQNALGTIGNKTLPLTTLKEITDSMNTPSSGFTNFSSHSNLTPYVGKMLEFLDRMVTYLVLTFPMLFKRISCLFELSYSKPQSLDKIMLT